MSDKPQKKRREEGIVRERGREKVAWKKENEGEGKKTTPRIVTSSSLACFYLTNLSVHSLLSSFLHIFSSPYLLSQHCITCHFRIMSSHVYNDIAFVPQITLGFSVTPHPSLPSTHGCWNKDTDAHTNCRRKSTSKRRLAE